jgi:hypothetical protein
MSAPCTVTASVGQCRIGSGECGVCHQLQRHPRALSPMGMVEVTSTTQGLARPGLTRRTLPGEGVLTMVIRRVLLCLWLGILSTVPGCYGAPSPSDHFPYSSMDIYPKTYHGPSNGQGIDYERQIDEQEQHYRSQRRLQERTPEPAYREWEREQERVRDPRQGG